MKKLQILLIGILLCGLCMSFTSANVNDYTSNLKLLIHANQSPTNPTYFNDSSPLYHVGTTIGSTTTDADIKILGNASMLNAGSGNYVEFISATDFALSGDWTIVANVNSTSLVGDEVIVSIGTGIKNYTDVMLDGAYVRLKISNVSGNAVSILDTVPVTTNTWHSVIAMRQGNDFSIYKDGIQIGTNYTIAETFPEYTTVRIGSSVSGTTKAVTGHIDECAVWNTTIPISDLYPPREINVAIPNSITANFTASNTSGIQPLFVDFTDTSTTTDATIDAWNYSFGDGNVSSLQNPNHTYEIPGTYQANLTITNTSYSLVSTKLQNITVFNLPPVSDFSVSNSSGSPPLLVLFTDTSTGANITAWNWSFGDGTVSSLQNPPVHTFNSVNDYQINLTVTNDGGSSTKLQNVTVATFASEFTASNWSGLPPLLVQFTDTTVGNKVDTWNWTFGDFGAGNTSTDQNPTHTYTVSGTYTANLTVTNGTIKSTKLQNITVFNLPPVSDFSVSNSSGSPPLLVLFTDTSTGANITAWNWSLGDGTVSSLQNPPVHTYADNGTYSVNLTVTNDGGSSTKLLDIIVSFFASSYTATPTSGLAPLTVTFSETTTGSLPDSYYWEFGDGGTDTVQNPVHIYNTIGIYNVAHRIINGTTIIWNNKTAYIHANRSVEADFTGTPLTGYLNPTTMSVSFTDTSLGEGISQWSWNFGDGSINATTQNPTHAYALPGTYNVFLKVWGADGNNSITKPGYITVNPLVVNFTTSSVSSTVGVPIFFNDTSNGYPVSWYWDFGDGATSTLKNNSYAYSVVGTYTIKFRATNGVETGWKNVTNLITITGALPPTPVAAFEAIPVTAPIGTSIQFYDQSGNTPTSWSWTFGDGGTSTLKNPSHTYTTAGLYTVILTATNSEGSDTETKVDYITITNPPAPTAAFTGTPNSSYVGGTVAFTDESTDVPTGWLWNFGDGTYSTDQNPAHIYTAAGTYSVALTASNLYGNDTLTKPAYITVSGAVPTIPPTSYVITKPATDLSNNAATMNGYTAAPTYTYHFEYGLKSGTYSYVTKPEAGTTGNFSALVEGIPLLPEKTYYFRAVIEEDGEYINGNELTYVTSTATTITVYPEFESRANALIEANWDFETLLVVIPSPFVDTMGSIFWGIIFGGAFFVLWARTHKIVIPALFGILSGGMMWNVMPPEWVAFGSALFYVSIAAMGYRIILGRQS